MIRRKTALIGVLALSLCGMLANSHIAAPAHAETKPPAVERRYFTPHPVRSLYYDTGILTFASGDIDGDHDIDIVGLDLHPDSSELTNSSSIWFNDGTGNFSQRTLLDGIDWALNVELADLDGDTDLDMLVSRDQEHPELILLNDGNGTFEQTGAYDIGATYQTIVGDFDGDDDLDVLGFYHAINNVQIDTRERLWLNDGTGVFTESTRLEITSSGVVHSADFDGDADLDLLVDEYQHVNLFLNNGAGSFTLNHQIPATGISAVGDLDGDGDVDAIGSSWSSRTYSVWYNDGTGTFTVVQTPLTYGAGGWFWLSDLDQDHDLDAVLEYVNVAKQVFVNDGSGQFMVQQAFGEGEISQIVLADVNSDTWTDIITINTPYASNATNAPSVWLNKDFKSAATMSTVYTPFLLK